jgi:predicted alpha/beta superfamily hydrolase
MIDPMVTFGTAVDVIAFSSMHHLIESSVVVGVGYPGGLLGMTAARTPDLTPPSGEDLPEQMRAIIGSQAGGADTFLSFLVDELTSEICRRVPQASATRRVLFGHSFGGLFAIHALLTRPDTFETFCASSPSLWWSDFAVLKLRPDIDEKLARFGVKPNLFLCAGALEQQIQTIPMHGMSLEEINAMIVRTRMVDACVELAHSLKTAPLGRVAHKVFDEEDHATVVPAAISRALQFALKKD